MRITGSYFFRAFPIRHSNSTAIFSRSDCSFCSTLHSYLFAMDPTVKQELVDGVVKMEIQSEAVSSNMMATYNGVGFGFKGTYTGTLVLGFTRSGHIRINQNGSSRFFFPVGSALKVKCNINAPPLEVVFPLVEEKAYNGNAWIVVDQGELRLQFGNLYESKMLLTELKRRKFAKSK
ncbi:hypothetical protein M3Y95_01001000 [Aphelenchoides besseyi]|nr:hypothetical protein M3Y95_01001000 [Aphelenchoides besseyi]